MHNRQDKTALSTSREQFGEPKLGVCISQLLSVCRDSKGHLSLHSWAGSQLEPINRQHLAQALSLLLPAETQQCCCCPPAQQPTLQGPLPSKSEPDLGCPQPGRVAALKLPGPGRVATHQKRQDSCGSTPPFPCSVQTTIKLGNMRFALGELQLEKI